MVRPCAMAQQARRQWSVCMVSRRLSHRVRAFAFGLAPAAVGLMPLAGQGLAQNSPSVGVVDTEKFGPVLVDQNGMALYTWVADEPGISACYAACATSWPPALVDGAAVAPSGLPGRLGTT